MFNALLEKLISDKSYKYFEDLKKQLNQHALCQVKVGIDEWIVNI